MDHQPPRALRRFPMMKLLRESSVWASGEMEDLLSRHCYFILSGGGGGRWETFSVGESETAIIVGVYVDSGKAHTGHLAELAVSAQSVMQRLQLPEGLEPQQAKMTFKRLEGGNLENIFLPYADMSGITCVRQNLKNACLEGSLAVDSDLSETDFSGAILRYADLSRCEMIRANLRGADLTGADLEDADMTGADLTGALTTGANFKNARMDHSLR